MYQSLISILIPVFNAERYLSETLESIQNQTWENLEIILVNDGSTDKSQEIIEKYAESDKRIRYLTQPNAGQCAALNKAITFAQGDFIKFFDADDIMNSEHIALQVKKLNGSVSDIASCEWGRFYNGYPESAVFKPEPVWQDMKPMEWIVTALSQKADMMGAPLWLIPRQVIEKTGLWNEQLSLNNDFDFCTRVILNSTGIRFTPGAKLYYRSGQVNSLAASKNRKAMESALRTTQLGCKTILAHENSPRTRRICANRFKYWMFKFYPYHFDLFKQAKNECKALGGSKLKMDAGPRFKLIIMIFGWKLAKKLKSTLDTIT